VGGDGIRVRDDCFAEKAVAVSYRYKVAAALARIYYYHLQAAKTQVGAGDPPIGIC